MLPTKERINRKMDKQADRHIDTNKHFPFEEDNLIDAILLLLFILHIVLISWM